MAIGTVLPCTGSGMSPRCAPRLAALMPITRPTSRTTLLLLSWWKVAICPTDSCAVLLAHVVDDLLALVHAEVDVEVGHRHALGVQESLEEQAVGDGVEVGDAQRIGDERPRARTAAGPDGHVVLLGPVDEVLDDEEVAREAHRLDDRQLVVEPMCALLDG